MSTQSSSCHIPVLLKEVLRDLNLQHGEVIVDGTLGGGGYATAILEQTQAHYIGIDQDSLAIERTRHLTVRFPHRFRAIHGSFGDLDALLDAHDIHYMDAFVADLGFSSDQMDDPERGFSFMHDGPLDMRMNPQSPLTAACVLNTYAVSQIADILWTWGEEPASRRIAQAIEQSRAQKLFERTTELRDLIARLIPKHSKIHPATRTFQALRIFVNQEIDQLHKVLSMSTQRLNVGGRLAMVSFHSLEDRVIKSHIRSFSPPPQGRFLPHEEIPESPSFYLEPLHKKVIRPQEDEIAQNPRARSAKLRTAIKRQSA